jgi:hypothetical protein
LRDVRHCPMIGFVLPQASAIVSNS